MPEHNSPRVRGRVHALVRVRDGDHTPLGKLTKPGAPHLTPRPVKDNPKRGPPLTGEPPIEKEPRAVATRESPSLVLRIRAAELLLCRMIRSNSVIGHQKPNYSVELRNGVVKAEWYAPPRFVSCPAPTAAARETRHPSRVYACEPVRNRKRLQFTPGSPKFRGAAHSGPSRRASPTPRPTGCDFISPAGYGLSM